MTLDSFLCFLGQKLRFRVESEPFLSGLACSSVSGSECAILLVATLSTTEEEVGRLWSVLESCLK